jgi:hypothetical protein
MADAESSVVVIVRRVVPRAARRASTRRAHSESAD